MFGELEGLEEFQRAVDGERAELVDVQAPDGYGQVLGFEALAMAFVAFLEDHHGFQSCAQVFVFGFTQAPYEIRDDALEGLSPFVHLALHPVVELDDLLAGAVEQDVLDLLRQLVPGGGQAEMVMFGQASQIMVEEHDDVSGATPPQRHCASPQGEGGVRHDGLRGEGHSLAQAIAARAGSEGRVEGEVAREEFSEGESAVRAGELFADELLVPAAGEVWRLQHHAEHSVALLERKFHGVVEPPAVQLVAGDQAVHYRLDGGPERLLELDFGIQRNELAVDARPHKAVPPHLRQDFDVLAFLSPDVWRQEHQFASAGVLEDFLADGVGALAGDFASAAGAVGGSQVCIEQSQVVVDFGGGRHNRAW